MQCLCKHVTLRTPALLLCLSSSRIGPLRKKALLHSFFSIIILIIKLILEFFTYLRKHMQWVMKHYNKVDLPPNLKIRNYQCYYCTCTFLSYSILLPTETPPWICLVLCCSHSHIFQTPELTVLVSFRKLLSYCL